MPTQTQPWLRAELIAAPETTPGAQLMIPADGVEFHDDQLVFHHQGDIVYVAPQGQLRSITWFAKQPNPETARRKAQWPKHGTRWTDDERADLLRHLRTGHSWKAISHAHGRSRTGCQQEAIKQGWLDPETLQPTAALLLTQTDATSDAQTSGPDLTAQAPTPPPAPEATAISEATQAAGSTNSAPADSPGSEPSAAKAYVVRQSVPADTAASAPPNATLTPALADPPRQPALTNAAANSPLHATPAGASAATPGLANPPRQPALANASADSPPNATPAGASAATLGLADPPRQPALTNAAADSPPNATPADASALANPPRRPVRTNAAANSPRMPRPLVLPQPR